MALMSIQSTQSAESLFAFLKAGPLSRLPGLVDLVTATDRALRNEDREWKNADERRATKLIRNETLMLRGTCWS